MNGSVDLANFLRARGLKNVNEWSFLPSLQIGNFPNAPALWMEQSVIALK